ncbi:RNA-binding protein [candidate division KSB1 bacterium]|nr:RNA-binding protein [candidate division KSB1 bacterium]
MNLYVGNMSYEVSEDDLKALFAEYGEVESVNMIIDRQTGRSKGFAFVEMPSNSEADQAVKNLNGHDLKGRKLKVNQAKPKEKRRPFRPRY